MSALFAGPGLSGRRPDLVWPVLYLDRTDVTLDADALVARVARRAGAGPLVRLVALVVPSTDGQPVSLSLQVGSALAALRHENGTWTALTDDGVVPVAQQPLVAGCEHLVSLTVHTSDLAWREVVLDAVKVAPTVVDLVPGDQPPDEFFTLDVGGDLDAETIPEWARDQIRATSAEELLALARERGGRVTVSHTPPRELDRVERPAPMVTVPGDHNVFTFSVESAAALHVVRLFSVEAS